MLHHTNACVMFSTLRKSRQEETLLCAIESVEALKEAGGGEVEYHELCMWLGRAYLGGWCNVDKCVITAVAYLEDAACDGCLEARTLLAAGYCEKWIPGELYEHGLSLYLKLFQSGFSLALKDMGRLFMDSNFVDTAIRCYMKREQACNSYMKMGK